MKILFLHPTLGNNPAFAQALKAEGVMGLFCTDPDEAWQMLQAHGKSIDLAVIHREMGGKDKGLGFIETAKADPDQQDLPMILTSEIWGDTEFKNHQKSSSGVNAYLSSPFKESALLDLMKQVLGDSFGSSPMSPEEGLAGPLEDPSAIYESGSQSFSDSNQISLSEPSLPSAVSMPSLPLATATSDQLSMSSISEPFEPTMTGSLNSLAPDEPSENEGLLPAGGVSPLPPTAPDELSEAPSEEPEVSSELPYLFGKGKKFSTASPERLLGHPLGDAVIPGGAAQTPDEQTLKSYLLLREQDVAVLSSKLKTALERMAQLETELSARVSENEFQQVQILEFHKSFENQEARLQKNIEQMRGENQELRFQLKEKTDALRHLEKRFASANEEIDKIRERVRVDIRKIRTREKELENKLELVKKDSEAVIESREARIIELKRKLDLMEYNLDLLQGQYTKEKDLTQSLRSKLAKAAQVVRVAGGLLDQPAKNAEILDAPSEGAVAQPDVELDSEITNHTRAS